MYDLLTFSTVKQEIIDILGFESRDVTRICTPLLAASLCTAFYVKTIGSNDGASNQGPNRLEHTSVSLEYLELRQCGQNPIDLGQSFQEFKLYSLNFFRASDRGKRGPKPFHWFDDSTEPRKEQCMRP